MGRGVLRHAARASKICRPSMELVRCILKASEYWDILKAVASTRKRFCGKSGRHSIFPPRARRQRPPFTAGPPRGRVVGGGVGGVRLVVGTITVPPAGAVVVAAVAAPWVTF